MRTILRLGAWILPWLAGACESAPSHQPADGPPAIAANAVNAAVLPLGEQVKLLSAASRPGPQHAALAELSGEWDVVLPVQAGGVPQGEPYRGHATLQPVLGGRFLRWEATVDFGGTPGTTTGFLGFDSRLEEYVLLMISDTSQAMEVARGTGDLSGRGIVFTLEQLDPRSGMKMRARSRIRRLGTGHFLLEQLEADASGTDRVTRVWDYRRATVPTR